jgi:hypothetical protein
MRSASALDLVTLSNSMSNGTFIARASISEIHFIFVGMPQILAHNDESSSAT